MHEYKRLSTLNVQSKPIKSFSDFRPGDCIVSFSRKQVFAIKNAINKSINRGNKTNNDELNHCAIIYGALPPETKKTQAYMFNNRIGDIKFLVATDAVIIIHLIVFIDWHGLKLKHLESDLLNH